MPRILHAGFHKTGSTFLQKYFFPYLGDVVYVNKISLGHVPIFDERSMSVLFSSESACGLPCPEAQPFNTERLLANVDLLKIDKVLIVERDFYSWVLSLYFQSLNENHTWTLREFIEVNRDNLLTWKEAAKQISDVCKKNNIDILVVPYEELLCEQKVTLGAMAHFFHASSYRDYLAGSANTSKYGVITIFAYRMLNKILNNRFIFFFNKVIGLSPRRVINSRFGLGAFLDRLSRRRLSVDDVKGFLE